MSLPIIAPVVHLNGTSKKALLDQLRDAYQSINVAREALMQCAPHMRDYYVYNLDPAKVFQQAVDAHWERVNQLTAIRTELGLIAEAINRQGK